ncbi:hypothetical protein [Streptomyces sp. NPDC018000]|uniref:hypothetical protein n=1 Tax=Streptomyces sp. NPDC018000 TaxID=3365028 RepID=UPI0037ABE645
MTTAFFRRAGAAILTLQIVYILLFEIAFMVLVIDTSEIDHSAPDRLGAAIFLATEIGAAIILLGAAAVLTLPRISGRIPRGGRAAFLCCCVIAQCAIAWMASSNAMKQDAGPDVLINAVMILLSLMVVVACVLGIRDDSGTVKV